MDEPDNCLRCGAEIPPKDAGRGQCPVCLFRLALERGAPGPQDDIPTAAGREASPAEAHGRIGPYKLLAVLGSGGMGDVYLAEQETPMRRRVAVKVIKRGMDSKEVIARFESERQALALMSHPSIARVLDAGSTEDGRPFFVMEHVAGVWITEYCDRHALDGRARLELFHEVCQAIQHAHQKGIIHRDIKPSNILVSVEDARPRPKVIDFGVAKAVNQRLTEKTLFTQQGVLVGTPGYISPEQAEVTGLDIDIRTDLYSLGVVFYELMAGSPPFDPARLRGAGWVEMLRIIREEEPLRPSARVAGLGGTATDVARRRRTDAGTLRRQLSGDLDWIALKCLEKDRTRRYQSATELAADIQRYLHDEPVMAGPPTLGYRLGKAVRRHRVGLAAAAAVLIAIVGGLVASTALYVRAEAARAETQAKTDDLVLAQARSALQTDPTSTVAWLKHYSPRAPGWSAAQVLAADARSEGVAFRVLPGHEARVYGLAFFPDGRTLASGAVDGAIRLWDVATGSGRLLARGDWHVHAVSVSPDGGYVAASQDWRVGVFRAASGEGAWYDFGGDDALTFTRDGREVIAVGRGRLTILDVREGRIAFQGPGPPTDVEASAAVSPGGSLVALARDGGEVELWDVRLRRRRAVRGVSGVSRLAFCGGESRLAAARGDEVQLIDVNGGWAKRLEGQQGRIESLACSPDGTAVVSGGEDWVVRLWETGTGSLRTLRGHRGEVERTAFSPDGSLVASLGSDERLLIWERDGGDHPSRVLRGGRAGAFAFSTDGRSIATGFWAIRLYATRRDDLRTLSTPTVPPADDRPALPGRPAHHLMRVAVSRGGRAAWAEGASVHLTDTRRDRSTLLSGPTASVGSLAFSANDRWLAAGSADGRVHVWEIASGRHLMFSGSGDVSCLAFSPDEGCLAFGTWGREVHLQDLDGGGSPRVVGGFDQALGEVTWSPNGEYLAAAVYEVRGLDPAVAKDVFLWPVRSAAPRRLRGHAASVFGVAFSPDSRWLASGSLDHTVRLWEIASGRSRVLKGHGDLVANVRFTPDGRSLLSTSNDGTSRLWNLASGESRILRPGGLIPIEVSGDGRLVLLYTSLWDLGTFEHRELAPLRQGYLVLSPDGRFAAGLDERERLQIWDDSLPTDAAGLRAWLERATNHEVRLGAPPE
jgi:WD40 repeat protein/serine/threonine protein kinase